MKVLTTNLKIRLVIICILIGTIPAVIVGAFSYYKASNTVQARVDEGNTRILQQVEMSVEQILLISDHVMLQLVESPVIKSSLSINMGGTEFQSFNNIETAINNLPTAYIGNNSFSLANFSKDWVVTYNGVYKLEDFEMRDLFKQYLKLDGSSFWVDSLTLKSKGISGEEQEMNGVSLIKKSPIYLTNPESIVVMNIPYSRLSQLLSESHTFGELVVVSQDGCVVAHGDKKMWGTDISDQDYFKTASKLQKSSGNFVIPINGYKYSVNFIKSDYNNWIYFSITSLDSVTSDSKSIGWFTFFACLFIIILINFVAFFISNRIYMPIGKLYNLMLGLPGFSENMERKDELVIIEDRVNYLLNSQVKLKKQVYSQIEQLKEFFILKLLLSEMDKKFIDSRIKFYDYPEMPEYACVWVVRIDTLEGTGYTEEEIDLMLFAVNNIIGELLEKYIVLKPVVIDEYQVTIVGGDSMVKTEYKDNAYKLAKHVQDVIKNALEFSVSIGISKPVQEYCEINRGYIEGIEALKHQILLGYNAIIFLEDVHRGTILKPIFPSELEEELITSVKQCNHDKAVELLHQFVDRVFRSEVSRYEYQVSIIRLATDLIFLLKESGESYSVLINDGISLYEKLLKLKTVGEVENWFDKNLINPIISILETAGGNLYKRISDEILKIIHEEYDRDLTLEECSTRLNYHPSYIRRILKREAGISFSEYLGQYRMDMAKKMLTETDMRVSDIAEKLRYKNPENFIRGFKKLTGITPGQYRDQNKT